MTSALLSLSADNTSFALIAMMFKSQAFVVFVQLSFLLSGVRKFFDE